jgi:aquaporin Z
MGRAAHLARGGPTVYDPRLEGLAANGYGLHSPGGYGAAAALLTEVVMTFIFLMVILGATSKRGMNTFAGIAIGLCLTLILLVGIPVDNLSVNPARSTAPALFVGGWALRQLWLFWVAPLIGAVLAGLTARLLEPDQVFRAGEHRIGPPGREEMAGLRPLAREATTKAGS